MVVGATLKLRRESVVATSLDPLHRICLYFFHRSVPIEYSSLIEPIVLTNQYVYRAAQDHSPSRSSRILALENHYTQ